MRHPGAFEEWSRAQALLWDAGGTHDRALILDMCRDALRRLASEAFAHPDGHGSAHTGIDLLEQLHDALAVSEIPEKQLLLSLLAYWRSMADTAELYSARLELLPWERVRGLVFNTAVVMFELDRALEFPERVPSMSFRLTLGP